MEEIAEKNQSEIEDISTLRIVAKREGDKDPYTANIPVKGDTFSLVLPDGYVNWPDGKPYPNSIRIPIDGTKNLWVNFNVSENHGFYTSLKISEKEEE